MRLTLREFKRSTWWLLLLSCLMSMSGCRGWWFYTPGDTVDDVGYQPKQPIPFNHKNHAGDRKIPCEYCHSSARRAASAGIPSGNTCMGCHKIAGVNLDPIKLMTEKYNHNEPIEWVKVHDLPDFVRFTHKPHIAAGVACQDCHGKVEEMAEVRQVAPLQMGWCISCHQKPSATKEHQASLDCQACHF